MCPCKGYSLSVGDGGPECTVSLSLVRGDVLSLIKELHVLFSHKNISWGNLVSVLMDSGSVMRATKVDTKKPFEKQSMSLLTYSLMAVPPRLNKPFLTELEESFKMHLCSFLPSNAAERHQKEVFFFPLLGTLNITHDVLVLLELVNDIIPDRKIIFLKQCSIIYLFNSYFCL